MLSRTPAGLNASGHENHLPRDPTWLAAVREERCRSLIPMLTAPIRLLVHLSDMEDCLKDERMISIQSRIKVERNILWKKFTRVEASKGIRGSISSLCLFGVPFNTPGWPTLSSVQKKRAPLHPRFSTIPRNQPLLATTNISISAVEVCELCDDGLRILMGSNLMLAFFSRGSGSESPFEFSFSQ